MFANSLKINNDVGENIFNNDSHLLRGDSNWSCALAYVLFYFALVGFIGGCATIIFCVAAWIGFVSAAANVVVECSEK